MGLASIPGGLSLNVTGIWLDSYKTKQSPASYDPVIEWKGSLGPTLQSFNAGAYDYRLFTNLELQPAVVRCEPAVAPSAGSGAGGQGDAERPIIANNVARAAAALLARC